MAIVIGLHDNVRCPNNTGGVTFMSNLSFCLVKNFCSYDTLIQMRVSVTV